MGTNLTINNKQLILDLPASFEIDHNAFKGEQRIVTTRALGAKWSIQSDTVDVSLDAQGRFLKYSILSNITGSEITHTVTYTNLVTSEVFSIDIIQRVAADIYKPYINYGTFKTVDHHVFEIEFEKVSAFDMQIILNHSDLSLSNSMFSIHSIVQKASPVVRVQILKSNLSESRETDLVLTLNGVNYTKHIITDIEPTALNRNPSMHINVSGSDNHNESFATQIQYDGEITYKCSSGLLCPRYDDKSLKLNVYPNRSFEPKVIHIDTFIQRVKVQDIDVEVKAGVYPVYARKILNTFNLVIQASDKTSVRIVDAMYELNNNYYPVTFKDSRFIGNGMPTKLRGVIESNSLLPSGGRIKFVLKVGMKRKYYSIKIN